MDSVMLAYDLAQGRAWYVDGSGLSGAPRYRYRGRTITHQQALAIRDRRRQRGRRVPAGCSRVESDEGGRHRQIERYLP